MSSLFVIAGIIVTGGHHNDVDDDYNDGKSVELIREDGTTCTLPDLPQGRMYHSQVGLEACGGHYTSTSKSCVTFSAGTWTTSHTLAVWRRHHVSWASYPGGVLLLGGFKSNEAKRSTELLSSTSSTTTPQFGLAYDTE